MMQSCMQQLQSNMHACAARTRALTAACSNLSMVRQQSSQGIMQAGRLAAWSCLNVLLTCLELQRQTDLAVPTRLSAWLLACARLLAHGRTYQASGRVSGLLTPTVALLEILHRRSCCWALLLLLWGV